MESKKEKRKDKGICEDFYNKYQNYHRSLPKIEVNRLKYDEMMDDMYGVSSVMMKDVIMKNAGDPSHIWGHYLVKKKDELLLEGAALLYDTVIINKMLNSIADGGVIDIATECYIDRDKKHNDTAYSHNWSKPTMYSDTNRAILSQLKR